MTGLERLLVGLASLGLAIGVIALLSGIFAGQDPATLGTKNAPLGISYPDQGDRLLPPGAPHPTYDSQPPTSGAHSFAPIPRDGGLLTTDQLLTALATGDVVLFFPGRSADPTLTRLADSVAGPFTPALAAAGQAVVIARRPGPPGVVALAWTRMLRVSSAGDPRLRGFAEQWLGVGARGAGAGNPAQPHRVSAPGRPGRRSSSG